jgi:O-antigen ligase
MTRLIKILLLTLAFTPLIVDNLVLSPFVTGKNIFVWSIVVLVCILLTFSFFSDKKFRESVSNKISIYYKNPLFLSVVAFISAILLSTIFAVDKYRAFWGDIERAEGFVGIFCFFSIFLFILSIFEEKDWFTFFKLSSFVSLAVLIKEFSQFFSGISRPESFFGNTTFLAGYLVFSIFCSIVIFGDKGNKFWKYLSVVTLASSILGIFITQTRGTILGIFLGLTCVLIYGIVKGKSISYKKLSLRTVSVIILSLIVIFSGVFISTRRSELWQRVPGISRVALISSTDSTTQTRLLMANLSVNAINPRENGGEKLIIGWGQDNFNLAYLKYFNPLQFEYEANTFNRAHNKVLDVLVMNGVLGLVAYLSIFFILLYYLLRCKEFSIINLGLLFWIIAYFVHLLFIFDQITTYIPFFIILSYVVYTQARPIQAQVHKAPYPIGRVYGVGAIFTTVSLFLIYIFFSNNLPGYIQMHKFQALLIRGNTEEIVGKINPIFSPLTVAQADIRSKMLVFIQNNYKADDLNMSKLVGIAFKKEEEYLERESFDFTSRASLSVVYSNIGRNLNNMEFLKRGEFHLKELLSFSPNMPDYNYSFAVNLFSQKRFDESFKYFEKSFNLTPILFSQEKSDKIEDIYIYLFKYFYKLKDKEDLIKVSNRLIENNYVDSDNLGKIVNFLEKNNTWPNISFEK